MSTADDILAPPIAGRSGGLRLAEFAYGAFLLLIFVGLEPFALRDQAAFAQAASASGDALRQLAYASVFAVVVFVALRAQGMNALAAVPPLVALLLTWCLASAAWSAEPAITLRRATLEAVIVLSALLGVTEVGPTRSLQILKLILGLVLVANWLSIPLIHQAVHLPGDREPQLVGDWRGMFFHKNIAGSVTAITAVLFFFSAWDSRKWRDVLLFAAAVVFTLKTNSKSSLALLPAALAAGALYRLAWRDRLDRWMIVTGLALAALAAATFAVVDQAAIARLLADPNGFTGRAELWQGELDFIADHPLLGAGFGAFADTGALSPIHGYVASKWVDNASHGHNAYLELAVTIGVVGLALALAALVAEPALRFWRAGGRQSALLAPLFAVFVFMLLHNFVESDFLEGDGAAWAAFLVMLAALRSSDMGAPQRSDAEGEAPWPA